MSTWASKASLVTLPPELMDFIIPIPRKLHGINVKLPCTARQEWLAIRHDWREVAYQHDFGYYRTVGPHETMQTLRALSATCKTLRAYVLPLLWAVVHIRTVSELGRLRDALRDAPYIAPLIRNFIFLWAMNGDEPCCDEYPEEHGSLLDMAFIDRGAVWARTYELHGRPPLIFDPPEAARPDVFFEVDDTLYMQPGYASQPIDFEIDEHEYVLVGNHNGLDADDEEQLQLAEEQRREDGAVYQCHWRNTNASGPDGNGPDRRIKNADDFNEALGEIVRQLKALRTLGWECCVSHMPASVFEALKVARPLKALHLSLDVYRSTVITVPVWELASEVVDLSFDCGFTDDTLVALQATDEVTENSVSAFELPTSSFVGTLEEAEELQYRIACRTIVAAARGGKLEFLTTAASLTFQHPFAIRSLLPFWVNVHTWSGESDVRLPAKRWYEAAATLRRALAHVSLWLHEHLPGASDDRHLTRNDVQSLRSYFKSMDKLPTFVDRELWNEGPSPLVELYLPWLEEDAVLAQQVADAWNTVVERGDADEARCSCRRCEAERNAD